MKSPTLQILIINWGCRLVVPIWEGEKTLDTPIEPPIKICRILFRHPVESLSVRLQAPISRHFIVFMVMATQYALLHHLPAHEQATGIGDRRRTDGKKSDHRRRPR